MGKIFKEIHKLAKTIVLELAARSLQAAIASAPLYYYMMEDVAYYDIWIALTSGFILLSTSAEIVVKKFK